MLSVSLPVVFADGVRETKVGDIVVEPTLTFKTLLSLVSHMTGIQPHGFSVYRATVGTIRKIPLNAKVNIADFFRDGDGHYFFVKRSRRAKKASPQNKNGKVSNPNKKMLPENVMLLRRNAGSNSGFMSPPLSILDRAEYERRMMNLWSEREVFWKNMGVNGFSVGWEESNGGAGVDNVGDGLAVCGECLRAKLTGVDSGFHLCVEDTVTRWFRSPAGPISRPAKDSGKECP